MLVSPDLSTRCPDCGWQNIVFRKRCRNDDCRADLQQHPDRAIDIEVRLDAADGEAYERCVGLQERGS